MQQITPQWFVAGQMSAADLVTVAAQGFSTVINNRPDGEIENQPLSAALANIAAELGMDYHAIPVVGGDFPQQAIQATQAVLAKNPKKVIAFCRSGTRSTTLWALSQSAVDTDTAIKLAGQAGYDLAHLRGVL